MRVQNSKKEYVPLIETKFPLRVSSSFGRGASARKATRKSQKLHSFVNKNSAEFYVAPALCLLIKNSMKASV